MRCTVSTSQDLECPRHPLHLPVGQVVPEAEQEVSGAMVHKMRLLTRNELLCQCSTTTQYRRALEVGRAGLDCSRGPGVAPSPRSVPSRRRILMTVDIRACRQTQGVPATKAFSIGEAR